MKICPKCGQSLSGSDAFCGNCGTAVPSVPAVPPAAPGAPCFCPNCGERIEAGALFCPNCGASTAREETFIKPVSAPKSRKTAVIAAAAACIVLLVAAGVLLIPKLVSSPAKKFISLQEGLLLNLSALEETLDFYGTGKFSTDMTISAAVNSAEIDRYLEDSSVLLKLDVDKDTLLADAQLVLMGSPVLSGTVTYDKGVAGIYLPEVDSNYYVMDCSELISELSGEDVDLGSLNTPQISGKEWSSLIRSYLDVVYTVVNNDTVKLEKGKSFRLPELGGKYTGNVYTFAPQAGDVEDMLLALSSHLEKDKTLRSVILKLVGTEELAKSLDILGGEDLEDALDDVLLELAEELRYNAASIGETVEDAGFVWKLYTEGSEVRKIEISTDYAEAFCVFEREGKTGGEITELLSIEDFTILNTYTQKGQRYTGEVTVAVPYPEGEVSVEYDLDQGQKSVLGLPYGTLSMDIEGISLDLEVGKASGGTDHILTLRGSESDFGYMFSRLELTVHTTDRSSAKKPSGKKVDITSYSSRELEELFNELGETISEDLIDNLTPLLYGGY